VNDRDLHEFDLVEQQRGLSTNLQIGLEAAQTAAALYGIYKLGEGGGQEAPPPPTAEAPSPPTVEAPPPAAEPPPPPQEPPGQH
jgi:hypothetical protein